MQDLAAVLALDSLRRLIAAFPSLARTHANLRRGQPGAPARARAAAARDIATGPRTGRSLAARPAAAGSIATRVVMASIAPFRAGGMAGEAGKPVQKRVVQAGSIDTVATMKHITVGHRVLVMQGSRPLAIDSHVRILVGSSHGVFGACVPSRALTGTVGAIDRSKARSSVDPLAWVQFRS